jgi:hypothetical protein
MTSPDQNEEPTISGLAERAAELSEDIAERSEVARKLLADEQESAEEQSAELEDEI